MGFHSVGGRFTLSRPASDEFTIGFWGELHRKFLLEHHKGITEELKAQHQQEWGRRMNNVQIHTL